MARGLVVVLRVGLEHYLQETGDDVRYTQLVISAINQQFYNVPV